jgi:hypothetical protein
MLLNQGLMMSRRKLSLIVGLLFLCVPVANARTTACQDPSKAPATQPAEYPNLKRQAQASADAFLTGDYKKLATLTYPKLVEMVGGQEALLELINSGMRDVEAKGLKVLSYTIGEPEQAVRIGQQLYAIVPTKMRMQAPQGVIASESFMIGISGDSGANWTFLGGAGATDEAQLRVVLPEVVGKLKLPEKKQPFIEPKQ